MYFSNNASEDLLKKRKSEDLENNPAASLLPLRKRHASQWKQTETTSPKSESNSTQVETKNTPQDQGTSLSNDIQTAQTLISPKSETSPTNSTDNSPLIGSETQKSADAGPKKNVSSSSSIAFHKMICFFILFSWRVELFLTFPPIGCW